MAPYLESRTWFGKESAKESICKRVKYVIRLNIM
jgi:hypothetical protein